MVIFYHSKVGFCVGKTLNHKPGEPNYWNPKKKVWEIYAIDCWVKKLDSLIKKCYPDIKIMANETLTLRISHLG